MLNEDGSYLTARGISRSYATPRRSLFRPGAPRHALADVSLTLKPGERVGLVGMSGSGKSTLLRALLAIERPDAGEVRCQCRSVAPASVSALRWYRRAVQYIPQDPAASLDPRMSVEALVTEPLLRLHVDCELVQRAQEALDQVGLDRSFLARRPGELSGGQAQRVAIARAIATRPAFLLADEPVSGLDLPIRQQVVAVFESLSQSTGAGLLIVSHDLAVVATLCQRTLVMHEGRIVEDRPTAELLRDPHHGHTRELIAAVPPLPSAALSFEPAAQTPAG